MLLLLEDNVFVPIAEALGEDRATLVETARAREMRWWARRCRKRDERTITLREGTADLRGTRGAEF